MHARFNAILALSASSIALATPAVAQSEPAAPSADSETVIGEIIVTAQRRSQSILDVPLTMSAFSGDDLKARNVVDLRDVADKVSGVQIFRGITGQPTWIIRGVGLVETNPNNPPPASVYLDDVYEVSNARGQLPLFDIARIEVLKGPQGGTYGRNTTGGAVKIVTREPDLANFGADATLSYGNFETMSAEAGLSIPIAEDVAALRLAGTLKSGGGWQYSLSDRKDWGDADAVAVRGTLLVKPAPGVRAKLIADYARDKSELPLLRANGARALASEGGTTAALWCPDFNAGSFSDNCRTYPGVLNALGFSFLPAASPSTQARDGSTTLSNAINKLDIKSWGLTFDLKVDVGSATLSSITAYRKFDYGRVLDADATGAELGTTTANDNFRIFSQDLRLASGEGGPFTWAVGLTYGEEKLRSARGFLFRDDPFSWTGFTFYGVTGRSQAVAQESYRQKARTWSGYVEAGYALTPTLKVSGALRYTDIDKTYTNGGFNFPLATGTVSALPAVQQIVNYQLSDRYKLRNNVTGNLYVSWKPATDTLLYASFGRGIKEGGFFGGFPSQGASSIVPFREETVWAYEAGFKLQALNRRVGVNGAVFYYDYGGAQASVPVVSVVTGAVFGRPGNVDAKHKGVELESYLAPFRGLRLSGSVTYLDAKYDDPQLYATIDSGGRASYQDLRREFAPKWSWTAEIRYDVTVDPLGKLGFQVDANGRSNRFRPQAATSNANPVLPAPTTKRELTRSLLGYTLLNGRVSYQPEGQPFSVAVFGRNLTDKRYVVINQTDGIAPNYGAFYNDPRTYGAELSFNF
jgi:iron complex outermembrane receptor protein